MDVTVFTVVLDGREKKKYSDLTMNSQTLNCSLGRVQRSITGIYTPDTDGGKFSAVSDAVRPSIGSLFAKHVDPAIKAASLRTMNTKSFNLTLAILAAIRTFNSAKANFSAHDVTKALRTEVEGGNLDITDVARDFLTPTGGTVANVQHSAVRDIVKALFDENFIGNYRPGVGRTTSNNTYVEYQYDDPTLAVVQKSYTPPAQPTPVPATSLTQTQDLRADAVKKALSYIENRLNEGRKPTLKATQSSIRRNPLSCEEIRKEALLAGYGILVGSTASLDAVVRR